MIAAAGITVQVRLSLPPSLPSFLPFNHQQAPLTPLPPSLSPSLPPWSLQEKFVTNGLPEFEFHRFALSDVYNFFF